jgi:hemerythrin
MSLMAWNDSYNVNDAEIDRQHRKLVAMLNELHDSMMRGDGNRIMGALLEDLIKYTKTHFVMEERLMSDSGYPGLRAHKAEHDALAAQVIKLLADWKSGRVALSLTVLTFLKNWLRDHILGSDVKLAAHLKSARHLAHA